MLARRRQRLLRAAGESRPSGRFLRRRRSWPLRALALLKRQVRWLRKRRCNPLLRQSSREENFRRSKVRTWSRASLLALLSAQERRLRSQAWPRFRQKVRKKWSRRSATLTYR
jgi:hypothetical protein